MKITKRFIVVDDDKISNLISKYVILEFNHNSEIQFFTDPGIALASIKETFSDINQNTVLFLDLHTHYISACEFLDEFEYLMQGIQNQITIYILSASIRQGDKDYANKNRLVKGYFLKPLSLETMKQTLV